MSSLKRLLHRAFSTVAVAFAPVRWKEFHELAYWRGRKKAEGSLSNVHYRHFYTEHFGLSDEFYRGKVILDVGCGPRGSLEWAAMAGRRIGVDPLAREYLRLGADRHQMEYLCAPAEKIPLGDAECDVVFSFNSLDHVENVERTLAEIKRVVRPGGLFLLLVEVNHAPTQCEPHALAPRTVVEALRPEFSCENLQVYRRLDGGMYHSVLAGELFPNPADTTEVGYMSAKFVRTPAA